MPSVYVHRYTYRVHTHTVEEHAHKLSHIYCNDRTLVQFQILGGGGCQKIGICIVLERERETEHITPQWGSNTHKQSTNTGFGIVLFVLRVWSFKKRNYLSFVRMMKPSRGGYGFSWRTNEALKNTHQPWWGGGGGGGIQHHGNCCEPSPLLEEAGLKRRRGGLDQSHRPLLRGPQQSRRPPPPPSPQQDGWGCGRG